MHGSEFQIPELQHGNMDAPQINQFNNDALDVFCLLAAHLKHWSGRTKTWIHSNQHNLSNHENHVFWLDSSECQELNRQNRNMDATKTKKRSKRRYYICNEQEQGKS